MLRVVSALPIAVVAVFIPAAFVTHDAVADGSMKPGAKAECAQATCDGEAYSVTTRPAVKGRMVARGGAANRAGADRSARPVGRPTLTSAGRKYVMGHGFGFLPRFGDVMGKKAKRGRGRRPVSAEAVVRRALARLRLPRPVIRMSPDEDFAQVVHVPTWMWLERKSWGPVSASAAVQGVRVVMTARPRIAVWSMGEGGQVVCDGSGTPYSAVYGPGASSPDCGYTYRRASLSSPGGAYTVSVRVTWDVQWHGGGRAGVVPGLVMTARRQLVVDEVQAVVTR